MAKQDMHRNESNLVPKQGMPNLEALRSKLVAPPAPATADGPAARPRRVFRRRSAWAGSLAFGAVLSAAGALSLLGLPMPGAAGPGAPDAGLPAADQVRQWDAAGHEPATFQALLGVDGDLARQEADARRLERLLSRQAHPGLE